MIFLTAFTQDIIVEKYKTKRYPGQFLNEYRFLLKSIYNIYPDAIPILYLFEGKIKAKELRAIHPKVIVFNWDDKYKSELGIDLNYLNALKATRQLFEEYNIVMLDPDCLIIKAFDEYINEDVDVTVVSRGSIKWNGLRNDVIFAPAIYHNKNKVAVDKYVDNLFSRGLARGKETNDWWANVQPCVTDIFLESGIDTSLTKDPGSSSVYGSTTIDNIIIKLKVMNQYILSYPIQDEKYYPETAIIHYKNHSLRSKPDQLYNNWCERKDIK